MMSAFDAKDWNLSQAAAWVVYRERKLVEQLEIEEKHAFGAIAAYPSMWPANRKVHGVINELHHALRSKQVFAQGYRKRSPDVFESIPAEEWEDLDLAPPSVIDARNRSIRIEPWTDVRVRSAEMKKKWRSLLEVNGRTKFDWPTIKELYLQLADQNRDISQNELIAETQKLYQDRFKKEPPSRPSMQNHIEDWR